jgi:ubiquinone/menaquinone biosynthesis C-methylase UbiE
MSDYSESFYREHAERYADVAHQYLQSIYIDASHPKLKGDTDLHDRLKMLAPGKKGLDAGCGAGARDVYDFWKAGYDMWGIDAVDANIALARKRHPEIASRVSVHDLRQPLPFKDQAFDFVMCNAVIQHIDPEQVYKVVLPELARVLRPKGVLQLMFKNGEGIQAIYDEDYETERVFRLYPVDKVLGTLLDQGMKLVPEEDGELGGIMTFTDPKPMEHTVFFLRR